MAVTQISRIQHRRGLEQDLPQLASAELGWSIDTRQLYIGNGTLSEGAPTEGVTRILTQYDIDDITSNLAFVNYTFVGNAPGYAAQTGTSLTTPIVRTYQQKFDDFVNVRDFGAVGDDSTDDTAAINRAVQQIYKSTVSPIETRARRTIYFPGGTYKTSAPILIPPFAKLMGDGAQSSIIRQTLANQSVANVCDSSFQTGSSIGSGSAITPSDIEIHSLQFLNSNASVSRPIFSIDSASNIKIHNSKFVSNAAFGVYPNLINIHSTVGSTAKITFNGCEFLNAGNAISIIGNDVSSLRIINSGFDNISNAAVFLGSIDGFTSLGNYFNVVAAPYFLGNGFNNTCAVGDNYKFDPDYNGLRLGNIVYSNSRRFTITTTPLVLITPVSNTSGMLSYQIRSDANLRSGTFTFTKNNSKITYSDAYVETDFSVNANLFANNQSIIVSMNSGTASLDFNNQVFISDV
jgi:hypothetical protein